jgi:AraC family transcriptional regulator, transcriptional activator of pobA
MDRSGDNLDETGKSQRVSRLPGILPSHRPGPSQDARSPARPQPITASLRSEAIASHFATREWRLASQSCREFHHGLLVLGGEARLAAAGEPLQVLGPSFVWMPAGTVDHLEAAAGSTGHLLAMKPDLLEHTFRQVPEAGELLGLLGAEQPLALTIDAHVAEVLAGAMTLVARELGRLEPGAQTVISSALVICLVQLWRLVGANALTREGFGGSATLLMRFRQLVEERFREHWPVQRYAEALGVSPDRLHAMCTRVLGRSPRVLIQQRILHEAVTRLERSAITIKQLAFVLGFKDTAYFNRFFRRQLGLPPGRYRRDICRRDAAQRSRPLSFAFADWP